MIEEFVMSNTQTPENQPPSPVESLDIGKKKNEIVIVLNRLAEIQDLIEEDGDDVIERYKPELEKMLSEENSYFVRRKIEEIMKPPLDDLDMKSKRIFLQNNWEDLCHQMSRCTVTDKNSGKPIDLKEVEKLTPLSEDDMSDSFVERYFGLYRKLMPYKYSVYERNRYEHAYDDDDIIENYKTPETNLTSASSFYFSRLNNDYCALYNYDQSGVTKFYKLDKETEKNIKEKEVKEGNISIGELENIVIDLEEAIKEKNIGFVKKYIYFRRNLPQSVRSELDKSLSLNIPLELDKDFVDDNEFKLLLHKHSKEIGVSVNEKDLNFLRHSLSGLLSKKYQTCVEVNNGFKTDNLFLLKNIARSFLNVSEGRYFWFEDYLREKQLLPKDLVDEFEKKFSVDFQKYETEEFPYYDDSFFVDIEKKRPAIKEHFNWLGGEILKRVEVVNQERQELKEIELQEILENEGFDQNNLTGNNNTIVLASYKALMELQTRKDIEDELGVKLSEFSFREQVQFVNFLSTKTIKEVEQVKEFLNQGGKEDERNARVKSFLSLEQDPGMGDVIISIGEQLKDQPEVADRLFAQYAEMVDGMEESIDSLVKMYNDIFFDKHIDKSKAGQAVLGKVTALLKKSLGALNEDSKDDKVDIINNLMTDLRRQEKVEKKTLKDLEFLAMELNKIYNEIGDDVVGQETLDMMKEAVILEKEKYGEEFAKKIDKDIALHKKYDSERVKGTIETYRDMYILSSDQERILREVNGMTDDDIERIKKDNESERPYYESQVIRLEKLLKLQKNLERKLDQLVYGFEKADLPDNFDTKLFEDIQMYNPELSSSDHPYLPVGISSELSKEDEVHAKPLDSLAYMFWLQNQKGQSELMVVDTIQESNYQALYGLSAKEAREQAQINGDKDRNWYKNIVGTFHLNNISMTNYQEVEQYSGTKDNIALINEIREGSPIINEALTKLVQGSVKAKSEDETSELLEEYGVKEIAFILSKEGQKIGHEKEYRYDVIAKIIPIYKALKDNMEAVPALRKVKGAKLDETLLELSLYLGYYDKYPDLYHLAAELFDIKKEGNRIKNKVRDAKSKEERSVFLENKKELSVRGEDLRERIKEIRKNQKQEQEEVKPINKTIRALGLSLEKPENIIAKWNDVCAKIKQEQWFESLKLPEFYYPKGVTAMSFEMQDEQGREFMGFKEFYSTEKGKNKDELPIEANQVIASISPMAAAKLMILSADNQKKYFNKVLKPLLVNFYIATSKDKDEANDRLKEDIKNCSTIADIVRVIQDKIIQPLEAHQKS